jgi:two-component system, OmpR family, alkaline phosphatase synthesis response regulator PhoP
MSRTILIVDDEEDIRAVARLSLEMIGGWTVYTADTGEAAVQLAAQHQPDAILLDVMMPELDGPATLQRLRAQTSTHAIPVIFLTAKVQAADHRRFATMPVSGVLPKPFDPMELPARVAAVLGWSANAA